MEHDAVSGQAYRQHIVALLLSPQSACLFLFNSLYLTYSQDTHGFAQVACDLTIEQTVTRDTKTRGRVKGFSNNQGATNRRVRARPP